MCPLIDKLLLLKIQNKIFLISRKQNQINSGFYNHLKHPPAGIFAVSAKCGT